MRIAVVTLTRGGMRCAMRVAQALKSLEPGWQIEIYVKRRGAVKGIETGEETVYFFDSLAPLLANVWSSCQALVLVMALGIVMRCLAPHLRDKFSDPAVLVVDEGGQFVISALGGHWAQANSLARRLAQAISAVPVITTSSDVQGLPAFDEIARRYGLVPLPRRGLTKVHAALVNGETVVVIDEIGFCPPELRTVPGVRWLSGEERQELLAQSHFTSNRKISEMANDSRVMVLHSDRDWRVGIEKNSDVSVIPQPFVLQLCPRRLVIGIGCRRGVAADDILAAIKKVLGEAGRRVEAVRALATVSIKAREEGLQAAARWLQVPLLAFPAGELRKVWEENKDYLTYSVRVEKIVGVGNVCETAALLAAYRGRLLVARRVFPGITVAVAEVPSGWWAWDPATASI